MTQVDRLREDLRVAEIARDHWYEKYGEVKAEAEREGKARSYWHERFEEAQRRLHEVDGICAALARRVEEQNRWLARYEKGQKSEND